MNIVERPLLVKRIEDSLRSTSPAIPVTSLLGPRQCGKTTIARELYGRGRGGWKPGAEGYFDMHDPIDRARLQNPRETLGSLQGLIVIDEIQQVPELFPILRVLSDLPDIETRRFLVLGSASPELIKHSSETLAGRIHHIFMGGFDISEVGADVQEALWLRGGYPDSFLAADDAASLRWRRDYIETFLRRDLKDFGINVLTERMRRFWMMVASLHGHAWNASAVAQSLGVSPPTARNYMEILTEAFILRQIKPYFINTKKRLVKSPKVYIRDPGILHALGGIESFSDLRGHHQFGFSWEGFVIEQLAGLLDVTPDELTFWGTQGKAEIDLVWEHGGKVYGFEMKASEAPSVTKSMSIAIDDLNLERVFVIYPGEHDFNMADQINAISFRNLPKLVTSIRS